MGREREMSKGVETKGIEEGKDGGTAKEGQEGKGARRKVNAGKGREKTHKTQ